MDELSRTKAEKQRALDWINTKWVGSKACPICTNTNWTVEGVIELRPYQGGGIVLGGSAGTYPAAQVICTTCGYIHFFNAVLTGVVVKADYEQAPHE